MEKIELGKIIGQGGEAVIWEIKQFPHFLAKIYDKSSLPVEIQRNPITKSCNLNTKDLYAKIRFMVDNPPEFVIHHNHQFLTWPIALLYDSLDDNSVGYVMQKIENYVRLDYLLEDRLQIYNEINWSDLHQIAFKISYLVHKIHEQGHVIVDLSPRNILVNPKNNNVSLIDIDSFQVFDKENEIYHYSTVNGTPHFIAPELLNNNERKKYIEGDFYSLAAIMHIIFFVGYGHEFGVYQSDPNIFCADHTQQGMWVHSNYFNRKLSIDKKFLSIELVHPRIQKLFYRCFDDGFDDKSQRPTPVEWMEAIEHSHTWMLKKECSHYYYHDQVCYWCKHLANTGADFFPRNLLSSIATGFEDSTFINSPVPDVYLDNSCYKKISDTEKMLSHIDSLSHSTEESQVSSVDPSQPDTINLIDNSDIKSILKVIVPSMFLIFTTIGIAYEHECVTSITPLCSYLDLAKERQGKKDLNGALLYYTKAISANPKNIKAFSGRGLIRREQNDLKGALEDFTKVISLDYDNTEAYLNRGLIRRVQNDLKGASEDFTMLIFIDPKNIDAYFYRGLVNSKKDKRKESLNDFTKVISLDPNQSGAYNNRGIIKLRLNDVKGALEDYTKAINLDSKNREAYSNRAFVKIERNDLKGALNDFSTIIKIDSKNADAYNDRGIVKQKQQNTVEAIQDFRQAAKLFREQKQTEKLNKVLKKLRDLNVSYSP
jgi:tetratricopeptide (TPR) repeat protein